MMDVKYIFHRLLSVIDRMYLIILLVSQFESDYVISRWQSEIDLRFLRYLLQNKIPFNGVNSRENKPNLNRKLTEFFLLELIQAVQTGNPFAIISFSII